jgi:hypothetical protein
MGTGYVRNDTSNNIADGNIINAADLDGEFDAIESAFGTSGHTHDGTSAEGGPITVLGPTQDFVASATEIKPKTTNTLDIGTSGLLFKDMYLDGVATLGSIKIDNAGTIGSASDADAITISSSGVVTFSQAPLVDVTNATTNAVTDVLGIRVQSTGTPAVGIGSGLTLGVETAAGNIETGGAVRIVSTGLTPTDEEIDLVFYSMRNGSLTEGFRYDSSADTFSITGSATISSTLGVTSTSTFSDDVTLTGASSNVVWDKSDNALEFADNAKATFGAGSDLQIYHDGSNSYIVDAGTGDLYFRSASNLYIGNAAGTQSYITATDGGAVTLLYNAGVKLATTATGVDITGTLTSDGLTVDGVINLQGTGPSMYFMESDTTDVNTFIANGSGGFTTYTVNDAQNVFKARINLDHSTGDISFYEDTGTTAKFFWDASAESLGIGTSSPFSTSQILNTGWSSGAPYGTVLTITGNNTNDANWGHLLISDSTTTTGNGGSLRFAVGATESDLSPHAGIDGYTEGANYGGLKFLTRPNGGTSTERMRIDSSGNVGIGTSSPTGKLSVSDPTYLSSAATLGSSITLNSENTASWLGTRELISFESVGNGADHRTGTLSIKLKKGNSDTTLTEYMQINAVSNYTTFSTAATERMRIDSSGKLSLTASDQGIQIGPDIAAYTIKRDGSGLLNFRATQTTFNGYIFDTVDGERMRIDSSGNVAVGTATALGTSAGRGNITINGSNDSILSLGNGGSLKGYILQDSGGMTIFSDGATYQRFYTNSLERMRIDSSGNVGIGTSSPDAPLHIESSTGNAKFLIEHTSPSTGTGQVGHFIDGNSNTSVVFDSNGYYRFGTSTNPITGSLFAERMRIDSSGNVGIGVTPEVISGYTTIQAQGSSQGGIFTSTTSGGDKARFYVTTDAGFVGTVSNQDFVFLTKSTIRPHCCKFL